MGVTRNLEGHIERPPEGAKARVAALYQKEGPGARNFAYLLTTDWATAEDITQEAFVRVLGRFGHLRNDQAFEAYLRRTIVNLVNSHYRRKHRHERDRPATVASPRSEYQPDLETRQELLSALARLPERQKIAVVLRYCEDLPEKRVADIMRSSQRAVRSLAARGTARLRVILEGEMDA